MKMVISPLEVDSSILTLPTSHDIVASTARQLNLILVSEATTPGGVCEKEMIPWTSWKI